MLEAFLTSTLLVAIAETGDKTQLLSFVLAAKLRRFWPIVLGIFAATIANHALAGSVGAWVASLVRPDVLRWAIGIAFVGFGLWTLKPDTLEGEPDVRPAARSSPPSWRSSWGDKIRPARHHRPRRGSSAARGRRHHRGHDDRERPRRGLGDRAPINMKVVRGSPRLRRARHPDDRPARRRPSEGRALQAQ
jgi:hypothetical protein